MPTAQIGPAGTVSRTQHRAIWPCAHEADSPAAEAKERPAKQVKDDRAIQRRNQRLPDRPGDWPAVG